MKDSTAKFIKNFYIRSKTFDLVDSGNTLFGKTHISVEVYKRRDVSNLDSFLGYMVMLNQRIIIPNQQGYSPGPDAATAYTNYPAILVNDIDITANNGAAIRLQQMFPKTLNASVSTSTSVNDSNGSSISQQNSSGSSTTNVNTYGVALNAGFFGDMPVGSLTLDYSTSLEESSFNSRALSKGRESNLAVGFGSSMNVKDWSSYGFLDKTEAVSPRWIWGQTYPWDVILYNYSAGGGIIELPQFVKDRLLIKNLVLPPSQLSLLGIDFTMQAGWLVDFPDGVTQDETITLSFTTQNFTASHLLSGNDIQATLQQPSAASAATYSLDPIDLGAFSLSPISGDTGGSGAAIGFASTPFIYPPAGPATPFKIVSPANNVQVTGEGFNPDMTTDLSKPTSIKILFKLADVTTDYSLTLMHWIEPASGPCKLAWTVNGKYTGTLYVDDREGSGGKNNLSSIELRNMDFTSVNFHDYLVVGTNEIDIVFEQGDPAQACDYQLFALALS